MTINHITFNFLNSYQEVVDESIKLVMKKRHVKSQVRGLTEHDLFFREVCFCKCKPICLNQPYHFPSCNVLRVNVESSTNNHPNLNNYNSQLKVTTIKQCIHNHLTNQMGHELIFLLYLLQTFQVSMISDIFECLMDHEEEVLRKQKTSLTHLQTVVAVNTIMKVSQLALYKYACGMQSSRKCFSFCSHNSFYSIVQK